MKTEYLVIVEKAGANRFLAYVPDIPECIGGLGPTVESSITQLKEYVQDHLEGILFEDGEEIPKPISTAHTITVHSLTGAVLSELATQ